MKPLATLLTTPASLRALAAFIIAIGAVGTHLPQILGVVS